MWITTDRILHAIIEAHIEGVIAGFTLAKSHPELELKNLKEYGKENATSNA